MNNKIIKLTDLISVFNEMKSDLLNNEYIIIFKETAIIFKSLNYYLNEYLKRDAHKKEIAQFLKPNLKLINNLKQDSIKLYQSETNIKKITSIIELLNQYKIISEMN